jgi:hypothetical protein
MLNKLALKLKRSDRMKLFKGNIELKGNYTLNVRDSEFIVNDKHGNRIYYEDSNGYWVKREYDEHGNMIYWENSNGYWTKREYDEKGNRIYWENSKGVIIDKRPKVTIELTQEQLDKIKESGLL